MQNASCEDWPLTQDPTIPPISINNFSHRVSKEHTQFLFKDKSKKKDINNGPQTPPRSISTNPCLCPPPSPPPPPPAAAFIAVHHWDGIGSAGFGGHCETHGVCFSPI